MDDYISRPEFQEYQKRMDDENSRQNKRLSLVEQSVEQITELTISIKSLSENMNRMAEEQKELNTRIKHMEEAPAKNWNTVKVAILTAIGTAIGTGIIATIIGYVF